LSSAIPTLIFLGAEGIECVMRTAIADSVKYGVDDTVKKYAELDDFLCSSVFYGTGPLQILLMLITLVGILSVNLHHEDTFTARKIFSANLSLQELLQAILSGMLVLVAIWMFSFKEEGEGNKSHMAVMFAYVVVASILGISLTRDKHDKNDETEDELEPRKQSDSLWEGGTRGITKSLESNYSKRGVLQERQRAESQGQKLVGIDIEETRVQFSISPGIM